MAHADRHDFDAWLTHRDAAAFRGIVARHAGMVYTTCRRILQNATEAEDVTQECFEALVQAQRLPHTIYLGAWLHGIATNRAFDRIRKDIRRERREARYTSERPAPATPEWNDIYELVDQALAELPDELRNPLVAHYLEGRTHREIAGALGIPRRTVSNRIARGLESLSETLRNRGVTLSATMLGALLAKHAAAWPLPPTLAASLGKLALAQGGSVSAAASLAGAGMLAKAAAGIVLASLALGAAWWLKSEPHAIEPHPGAVVNAATPDTPPPSEQAPLPPASNIPPALHAASIPAAIPEKLDCVLMCEVMRPDGKPVENAEVRLARVVDPRDLNRPEHIVLTGRTDARGELLFDDLPQANFVVIAQKDSDAGIAQHESYYYRRERIVLLPAATFSGTVRDASGAPVSEATLYVANVEPNLEKDRRLASFPVGTTDVQGSFSLLLPKAYRWTFHVKANNLPLLTSELRPAIANDLTLGVGLVTEVTVHAAKSDAPVAGATVVFMSADEPLDSWIVVADELGKFWITTLKSGAYSVNTLTPGFAVTEANRTVKIGPDTGNSLSIALEPAAYIAGTVTVAGTGAPVPDVEVRVRPDGDNPEFFANATTDTNGSYTFANLPAGKYRVGMADPSGYSIEKRSQDIELRAGDVRADVDFNLTDLYGAAAWVSGQLKDAAGRSIRHGIVFAQASTPMHDVIASPVDRHGAFRMRVPVTREMRLQAFGPNIASDSWGPAAVPTEGIAGIDIVAKAAGSIAGRVVTASKRPFDIDDVYIDTSIWFYRTIGLSAAQILPNGYFHLGDLPEGEQSLYLDLPAYRYTGIRKADAMVTLAVGQDLRGIEIPFDDVQYKQAESHRQDPAAEAEQRAQEEARRQRAWGIEGRVVADDTGKPVQSFTLTVDGYGTGYSTINDDDGRFKVEPQERPYAKLEIAAAGYSPHRSTIEQQQAVDRMVKVDVRLEVSPVIEGIVVDSAGNTVEGARIFPVELVDQFQPADPRYPVTGPDGAFRLNSVETGPHRMYAEHPSYAFGWMDVEPRQGVNNVTITLTHGGRIEGIATLGGQPAQGVRIGYYPEDFNQRQFSVNSGPDGAFVIENLVPGVVNVSAFPPGKSADGMPSRWRTEKVIVAEGKTKALEIDMRAATSRVEGSITYQGEPAPFAFVRPTIESENSAERFEATFENGTYRTDPIPAGEVTIWFEVVLQSQVRLNQRQTVKVGENEVVELNVDFPGLAVVEGTVSGLFPIESVLIVAFEGEHPIPDFVNSEQELFVDNIASTHVDDGAYILEGLEPGAYTIRAVSLNAPTNAPPRAAQATITITGNERIPLDFSL